MPSPRPKTSWRPLRRRLSAALALVAYFAATSGLPLPGAVVYGQPSLYQNRPCGYRPADDPSEQCCCCGYTGEPAAGDVPPPSAEKACPSCTGSSKSCCASHSDATPRPSAPCHLPGLTTAKCHCITTVWLNRLSSVRTITHLAVNRFGDYIWVDVEADGFLYNMVRAIAGTLMNVGRGYWPETQVAEILAAGDRKQAGPTAPACGLFLVRVTY